MRADLELVAGGLVDVRRAQEIEALLARRQRHRAAHDRTGALRRIHDLERRLVDQPVVERFETNSDALALHCFPKQLLRVLSVTRLLEDLRDDAGADGLAALADGK